MNTSKDKVYEYIAVAVVIILFVAYAFYNHEHTKHNYTTVPNTPANENAADQGPTNCSDQPFSSNC